MAEHHTDVLHTALATSHNLPSIFEVLAQDNLNTSVRPAVEYLCKFIVGNFPEKLDWLMIYFDEVYLVLDAFIQHLFLSAHGASYAEKYYSLQRVIYEFGKDNILVTQSKKGYYLSLLSLTLLPYFEIKLRKLYESTTQVSNDSEKLTKFGKVLNFSYPTFYTIWQLMKLYFQLSFAMKKQKYYSPLLWLLKIQLIQQTMEPFQGSNTISSLMTRFISGGVHACVFSLQFIQWWYTDANQAQVRKVTQGQIPPPPATVECNETKKNNICPICKKTTSNTTALASSGFVFCYLCIHQYLEKHGKCPVTKTPSHRKQLIKLYPPED